MKTEKISELTTNRLSVYLRCLNQLAAEGIKTVSSEALAKKFHLNSAQIRKDLAYFGEFGVRGVGYYVDDLRQTLTKILGLDKEHRVGIIGAGRLGTALADYYGFKQSNFKVIALFDSNREKVGQKIGRSECPIYDFQEFKHIARENEIDLAVIAVPAEKAQTVFDEVAEAGVKAVLNFAPTPLQPHPNVKLKTVDLTISLEGLSYFLSQSANGEKSSKKAAKKTSK
ncbi:MAG: redox-sensing transcriptional repressor Rex [Acidobacteriota bacterium]|nr:redox-sensing transcriptional repressor Rex [Acidobacteriota bacterium]